MNCEFTEKSFRHINEKDRLYAVVSRTVPSSHPQPQGISPPPQSGLPGYPPERLCSSPPCLFMPPTPLEPPEEWGEWLKFPELAGEAGLLERDGNLTGLTGVCKNKVDITVRVCCSFLPMHRSQWWGTWSSAGPPQPVLASTGTSLPTRAHPARSPPRDGSSHLSADNLTDH